MIHFTRRELSLSFLSLVLASPLGLSPSQSHAQERTLSAPSPGSFSIVVIPDTQAYRRENDQLKNTIFSQHIDWILENQEKQNIVFVSHVGDIVDKNIDAQWTVAQQCMNRLHGKIPYGISVGNHDMTRIGDASLFQKYFPTTRFDDFNWYGGCYTPKSHSGEISGNNVNSFQLFSAAGIDFVFLHLECNAPDDVLAWADEVLEQHVDRCAIVTTHMCLGPLQRPESPSDFMDAPKGRMQWKKIHGERGNTPEQMWNKCFRKHSNLSMICCGDQSRSHSLHEVATGDHGNQVHQLLSDYSTGWLRLYRFHPANDRVQACTFHPNSEVLCEGTKHVPGIAGHQFEFEIPFAVQQQP
ncbi:Calcineurin-like phosphoesterase [Novipirellula galeiformis]|uniref:Calcineurin-like phosphoesterase n=1 Tax=Novipirellula galeiformis TaxID=2528004 RepID=A0A5C6CHC0_9BACT|nr:metallophosphoesterase [Novipirellula galeiformis]TWU23425.1 Calcineurin-like phosphoesterase [Novipirellula galeiformis]